MVNQCYYLHMLRFFIKTLHQIKKDIPLYVFLQSSLEPAKMEYKSGKPIADTALAGARLHLRPILMTSFAFILGCVPLAMAMGAGIIARRVMGIEVIGGMLAATGVAIFLIPVTFTLIQKLAQQGDDFKAPENKEVSPHA
jgi:Cu/Ag efflux pump CusA